MKKPLASKPHAGIDLHVHSTASDGTLTPSDILAMAVKLGLRAIAITDHDTLSGSAAAVAQGIPSRLHFLTGIEISAAVPPGFQQSSSVHILGYGFNLADQKLRALIEVAKSARENRNPKIIARLNALGMNLDFDELAPIVGDSVAGRPHIAQLLVKKGLADSIDDAFDRLLGKNRPGYVEKYRVPMDTAIEAINNAGGIAVLAHPYLNDIHDAETFEAFLQSLIAMGLRGIEAIYPDHPEAVTAEYLRLAKKYGLLVTGGTDYHGEVTPGIQMGIGNGRFHVPYELYESLAEHLEMAA